MPSEEPLNIPGLPIGWKFGDPMPEGTVAEVDKPPVDESPLETVSNATNARRKRRPKQPLIFEVILSIKITPARIALTCLQNNRLTDRFLFMNSESRQVLLDRIFLGPYSDRKV